MFFISVRLFLGSFSFFCVARIGLQLTDSRAGSFVCTLLRCCISTFQRFYFTFLVFISALHTLAGPFRYSAAFDGSALIQCHAQFSALDLRQSLCAFRFFSSLFFSSLFFNFSPPNKTQKELDSEKSVFKIGGIWQSVFEITTFERALLQR